MNQQSMSRRLPQAAHDTRKVASEIGEMLAVLVCPAILLSGINLFFS